MTNVNTDIAKGKKSLIPINESATANEMCVPTRLDSLVCLRAHWGFRVRWLIDLLSNRRLPVMQRLPSGPIASIDTVTKI